MRPHTYKIVFCYNGMIAYTFSILLQWYDCQEIYKQKNFNKDLLSIRLCCCPKVALHWHILPLLFTFFVLYRA